MTTILHRSCLAIALAFAVFAAACADSDEKRTLTNDAATGSGGSVTQGGRGGSGGSGGSAVGTGGVPGDGGGTGGSPAGGSGGVTGTGGAAGGAGGAAGVAGRSGDGGVADGSSRPDGSQDRPPPSGDAGAAQALTGFRWEVPCMSATFVTAELCPAPRMLTQMRTLGGDPAVTYEVTLRFRGLVEPHTFTDLNRGAISTVTPAPYFLTSAMGTPTNIPYALFMIDVPQPQMIYYLNAFHSISGSFHHQLLPIDYTAKIRVRGGSVVRLRFTDGNTEQVANFMRVVVDGVPPAPMPFNGQFVQMDVVSVTP